MKIKGIGFFGLWMFLVVVVICVVVLYLNGNSSGAENLLLGVFVGGFLAYMMYDHRK